jgi:hypothetical protein
MVQPVQRPAEVEGGRTQDLIRTSAPAEPATARALWPTFMRRTLSEEALRRLPETATAK